MAGRVVVVTGTSTGVGKTVVTAALAAAAARRGERVIVVKPVQTGAVADSDAGEVHRLTGCAVEEWTALDEPLAPETAARRAGVRIPPVREYADRVRVHAQFHDLVLVEGAGGLLVRLDTDGGTLRDLAAELAATLPVHVVVVCAAGLGTLNHAELTVGSLRAAGLTDLSLVIGSWPADPGLAETCNRTDLPRVTDVPLAGVVPDGAGALDRAAFTAAAPGWLA